MKQVMTQAGGMLLLFFSANLYAEQDNRGATIHRCVGQHDEVLFSSMPCSDTAGRSPQRRALLAEENDAAIELAQREITTIKRQIMDIEREQQFIPAELDEKGRYLFRQARQDQVAALRVKLVQLEQHRSRLMERAMAFATVDPGVYR